MSRILVMTDLSASSVRTAEYAYRLASVLHMEILLYHCTGNASAACSSRQSKLLREIRLAQQGDGIEKLRKLSADIRKLAGSLPAGAHRPAVSFKWREGTIEPGMIKPGNHVAVRLLVSGGEGQLPRDFFFDGHIRTRVGEKYLPLLYVPPFLEFQPLKQVLLAAPPEDDQQSLLKFVAKLARRLHADLIVAPAAGNLFLPGRRVEKFMAGFGRGAGNTRINCQLQAPDIDQLRDQSKEGALIAMAGPHPGAEAQLDMAAERGMPLLLIW